MKILILLLLLVGLGLAQWTGSGGSRGSQEWILKQNTTYYAAIISATASNIVSIKMEWYEHTDKNKFVQ